MDCFENNDYDFFNSPSLYTNQAELATLHDDFDESLHVVREKYPVE